MPKVLAIGLDGLEPREAERLIALGRMPALASLRQRGRTARLEHGPAERTGLAWEHFASARTPEEAKRASTVEFDPATYSVWQEGARFQPFWEGIGVRTLVFDAPYVDLATATTTRGVVAWGAHDPGTTFAARPAALAEIVPPYPAPHWTYVVPWSSEERCRQMGERLSEAIRTRAAAACRVLREVPDWDLFVVVAGEAHTGSEGLWHGADPSHPAARHPSAPAAGKALDEIHIALDDMVAELVEAVGPDVHVVAFAMGGMGPNESDVASMFLLGELLHRHAFGKPLAEAPSAWRGIPPHELTIADDETWESTVKGCFPAGASRPASAIRRAARRLPGPLQRGLVALRRLTETREGPRRLPIDWMPITEYRHRWPEMPAFALPSFYDGRIRINLAGRERAGVVDALAYDGVCAAIEAMLHECRDPRTGERVVASIERTDVDPFTLRSDEADIVIVWQGVFNGFIHPEHGEIGPVPFRRTGGHTGPYGTLVVAGPGITPADEGVRSSFDVADVIRDLLTGSPNAEATATSAAVD
jgi:predicted AlkP superfamily phosphohydrolase/phosphomutase